MAYQSYNPYPYGYQNYLNYQQNGSMHNGGMVSVKSEQEAINYPVAPQTSVTMYNENAPYIYTKTVTSPFEPPKFEKFKLVKEDTSTENEKEDKVTSYVEKDEFNALKDEFTALKKELTGDNE